MMHQFQSPIAIKEPNIGVGSKTWHCYAILCSELMPSTYQVFQTCTAGGGVLLAIYLILVAREELHHEIN